MSSEEATKAETQVEVADEPTSTIEPATTETKKRPRLDISQLTGGRDRKRGKTMFGILLGTLNKAKIEDKERSASEAAKKRQLIDQRLQAKLRKETDSVRRAEEAKKDKTSATRREEELQLKDSLYKLRRTRLPLLSNFLLTSDVVPLDESSPPPPSSNPLALPPRSHPPPLYYLPVVLTPSQEAFLTTRKSEATEATEKEWDNFLDERKAAIEDISKLRQRVAEEEAKNKIDDEVADMETDVTRDETLGDAKDGDMELDEGVATKDETKGPTIEDKREDSVMGADDDDAVEY